MELCAGQGPWSMDLGAGAC